jgi:hypothetical protein
MSINRVCAKVEAAALRNEASTSGILGVRKTNHFDREGGVKTAKPKAPIARSTPLQRLRDGRCLDVQLPNRGQRRKQDRKAKGRQ